MSKFLKPSGPRNLRELWYAIWQAFKNVESSIGNEGGGPQPPDPPGPIPPDPPEVPGHYHDHRNILYRSEPDAHPISAITGLEDRISNFPYKDADTPVFLFGTGQSNLVGGPDAITEPFTPNARVFDWSAGGTGQTSPHSWLNQDLTAAVYADYTADPNATYTGMTRGRGNMLWAAADVIQRRTGRDVYILNVGRNGTAIAEWLPGGDLETVIVQRIAEVLATPELAGITFTDGIIWAQGESDGLRTVDDYVADFYTVRDWMEASFARKDTTLWAVTDTPSLEGSFFYNARYFYAYLDSRNDEFLRVVRADNYPAYDNLHFSGNDSMTMGTKVSRVFLEGPSPKMLNSDFDGPLTYELDDLTDVELLNRKVGQGLFISGDGVTWQNRASFTESWPTGLANGGELNIGPGINDIEVIAGVGVVTDSYTDPDSPPIVQALSWDQINEPITASPPVAGEIAWFSIYDTGVAGVSIGGVPTNIGALKQYSVSPDPTLAREEIFLGIAIHNGVEWKEVSSPKVINQTAETLREVVTKVLPPSRIISGGQITEQAGFTLNQAEGVIWENNRNWHVSKSDPNREALPAATPIVFEGVNRDFSTVQSPTSIINADQWDNNGVIEPIPGSSNTATIHRLYIDLANNYWLLIGQKLYANWNEAQANRQAYQPEIPFLLQNSLYLGAAIAEKGKADWGIDEATFRPPVESGGGPAAGTPITTYTGLVDTPASYTGDTRKVATVADDELSLVHDYRTTAKQYSFGATYFPQDMVLESGWLMVANAVTDDFPAPTPVGKPAYTLPDSPTWTEFAAAAVIESGHRYIFSTNGYFRALRVWVPETGPTVTYRITAIRDPNGTPRYQTIDAPLLLPNQWNVLAADTILIAAGEELLIYVEALNSGSNTIVTGGWARSPNSNDVTLNPGAGEWGTNNAGTTFRQSKTDLDATDRSTELAGIVPGSTIELVETLEPNKSITATILSAPVDQGTHFSWNVEITNIGVGGFPDVADATTFTATIPVAQSTKFVGINGYWVGNEPSWANVDSYLAFDGVDQGADINNAYGVDISFQELTKSDDWDVFGTPSGGAGGGGDALAARLDALEAAAAANGWAL